MAVLSSFVEAAMAAARYKILEDGSYYGEINSCQSVWANSDTLEKCREELREVLEEWLILKLRDKDQLPMLGGFDLNAVLEA